MLSPLLAGGPRDDHRAVQPQDVLRDLVERIRPTYFSAVPAIYAMLTSLPDAATADTSSLRLVVCGAAPMPAELIARVEDTLGVALIEGYGLSEGTCAVHAQPATTASASPARSACRCPGRRSASSTATAGPSRRASAARSSSAAPT